MSSSEKCLFRSLAHLLIGLFHRHFRIPVVHAASFGSPGQGNTFFCHQCRALQPLDRTHYFSLMDCNRSFRVNTTKLQHRFQQLQRLVHPDFFSQRSQTEKDFSEKHSTLVNDAYKTLLLKLHGIEIPKGTDYEMDSQFLMEIMEINEKLTEAQSEAAVKEIESTIQAKQKECTDSVSRTFEQDDFEKAKEILTKMKYFSNIEEKIKLKKIPSS
uniref:Co-chaperone HscB C-terminal oligomerisation domain-containing protein n=1 Tax=Spermophilus dauricus TaxID=99837 RepID=A0A8C9UKI1_SPEDA